ncbi:MAG: YihY/virulence factor BrkB family protein [Rubrobacteraceae bacterium]
MASRLSESEMRSVANRPVEGSLASFWRDLKALANVGTLKATVREFQRDDAMGLAAQLAYYLILALFPFILVLVSLMGTFSNPELADEVLSYFRRVMPQEVYTLIDQYTGDIISGSRPAPYLLSFGILFTIWSASGAFSAFINALNRAYDVQETRPFWKVKGLAILMTLGLSVLILTGVLLLVLGPPIGAAIAGYFGLSNVFELAWNIARWPVAFIFMVMAVALLYYFAPDADQPFRWITPGGFVGVILWVIASAAFSLYVNNFGSYDETYGSIGVVIILLLYLYIASLTILFGATLNATLVKMKEEISGERILDAEPAHEKPDILKDEEKGENSS